MLTVIRTFLTIVFGTFMVLAGVMHFANPGIYTAFFPASIPAKPIIYISGVIEILVGLAALLPGTKTRRSGAIGILVLMILYLPLHFIDIFKAHPAVGSHALALVRFALQFVLIYWAWYIARKPRLFSGR